MGITSIHSVLDFLHFFIQTIEVWLFRLKRLAVNLKAEDSNPSLSVNSIVKVLKPFKGY